MLQQLFQFTIRSPSGHNYVAANSHIIQDLSSQPEYRFQLPLFPALLLLLKKRMADDVFHFHIWQKERNFHSFQPVSLSTAEIVAHIDDEILHIGYDRIDTQTAPVTQFVDSKF